MSIKKYSQIIWLRGCGALKADAKKSYLGSLWWILDPILISTLMFLAFSSGLKDSESGNLFIFIITGMLPLKWTTSCISSSSSSLTRNKGIIGQVYLPKWIFPTCDLLTQSIRFLVAIPILLVTIAIFNDEGLAFNHTFLTLVLIHLSLNTGLSYCLASITPLIPDTSNLVPIITMGLMFTSGIFFRIDEKSFELQQILEINPFIPIIEGYRSTLLLEKTLQLNDFAYPIGFAMASAFIGFAILKFFDRTYPRYL